MSSLFNYLANFTNFLGIRLPRSIKEKILVKADRNHTVNYPSYRYNLNLFGSLDRLLSGASKTTKYSTQSSYEALYSVTIYYWNNYGPRR